MKRQVIQRYDVTLASGSHREACCGPRALSMLRDQGAVALMPVGEAVEGTCCHYVQRNVNLETINRIELALLDERLSEPRPTDRVGFSLPRVGDSC